jgi:hypothetical protein
MMRFDAGCIKRMPSDGLFSTATRPPAHRIPNLACASRKIAIGRDHHPLLRGSGSKMSATSSLGKAHPTHESLPLMKRGGSSTRPIIGQPRQSLSKRDLMGKAGGYRRRTPKRTVLHELVAGRADAARRASRHRPRWRRRREQRPRLRERGAWPVQMHSAPKCATSCSRASKI